MSDTRPLDPTGLKRRPIGERSNLVHRGQLGKVTGPDATVAEFLANLPDVLGARALATLIERVVTAVQTSRRVGLGLGAHTVKTGTVPYLIDLIERGVLGLVAMNGATAIHDLEMAMIGETSEDVRAGLLDGSFGMAEETFEHYNRAYAEGARGEGLGRALGRIIAEDRVFASRELSLLAAAYRHDVTVTVHVAVGTDIVHMHPGLDAEAMGRASYLDMLKLAEWVRGLRDGVWINAGSAVIMPEVFVKALNMARNLDGGEPGGFTAANLDMIRHYRPKVNVLDRPTGGQGIEIVGHHEILIPLLHAGILAGVR
jgi:hypothetical protein